MTGNKETRPPGTYRIGNYGDIRDGDWFIDAESGCWLYAATVGETEQTVANPHVKITFSASDEHDAALISDWFPVNATAGIVRPG
jgi:hypothetical protein